MENDDQFYYNGKWVEKSTFRAYVYKADDKKLANSYEEYESLITSGLWFSDKEKVIFDNEKVTKLRKTKNGTER